MNKLQSAFDKNIHHINLIDNSIIPKIKVVNYLVNLDQNKKNK
jgi:hypothetical protein